METGQSWSKKERSKRYLLEIAAEQSHQDSINQDAYAPDISY